jgi:hypothetical protein
MLLRVSPSKRCKRLDSLTHSNLMATSSTSGISQTHSLCSLCKITETTDGIGVSCLNYLHTYGPHSDGMYSQIYRKRFLAVAIKDR